MEEFNSNEFNSEFTATESTPSTNGNGAVGVKERAREVGDKLTRQVDRTREKTSSSLRTGSRKVEDFSSRVSEGFDQAREKTYSGLQSTSQGMDRIASYLEDRDAQAMLDDTRELVRRHPGKSMIAGLALGLIVGRLFSSNR